MLTSISTRHNVIEADSHFHLRKHFAAGVPSRSALAPEGNLVHLRLRTFNFCPFTGSRSGSLWAQGPELPGEMLSPTGQGDCVFSTS